jgi:thiopeptide-type bacteriocin biosynthesis protein
MVGIYWQDSQEPMPNAVPVVRNELEPSGFFVLRTPLLPFDVFQAWTAGSTPDDHPQLVERLRTIWYRQEVREAVLLASPELDAALERADQGDQGREGDASFKAWRSFVAYFARMCARSTPFGLFAGCSVGSLDRETTFELVPVGDYRRHTRLDMDYLSALTAALDADPAIRGDLGHTPNSSLYPAGARLHYMESRIGKLGRSYHLVALDESPELTVSLANAHSGATLDELAADLVDDTISPDDARAYVDELANNQVLISELSLSVTGEEPIHRLIALLSRHANTRPIAECLDQVRDELVQVDRAGAGGNRRARYTAIQSSLESLPATSELARLFQVDLVKPAARLTLGPLVVNEIKRGVDILRRLPRPQQDPLETFTQRFVDRYESAELPLVEVLDEEIGIGFGASSEPGAEPLLEGLNLPPSSAEPAAWRPHHVVLQRLLYEAIQRGDQECVLQPADIDALAAADPAVLPDAMDVSARLAATSAAAVDRGEFRVWLQSAGGPSGARLLGRFCHADAGLTRRVEEHLRAEEAHRPDALFAEIVHLPEGRVGNIICRPVLRAYEIPFLGHSGAADDRQIPVTDLRVSVRGGRVVLRSARLDCEVIPRLTAAHNFGLRSLGMYRFLCILQYQGATPSVGWSWGPLEQAPFLPRVVSGRLVLSRARWVLSRTEITRCADGQFGAVQHVRSARRLPRYVVLADGDNELVVDLDNRLSIEAFVHLVKGREEARLEELFPPPDEMCVEGPEGHFTHELIIPFVKTRSHPPAHSVVGAPPPNRGGVPVTAPLRNSSNNPVSRGRVRRQFSPGSEWLFAKIYSGRGLADRILSDVVRPLVQSTMSSGVADSWFFIRYADPEPHLRLRFHGDRLRLSGELLPTLESAMAALVGDGRIARWQLDTYVREVERYGGDEGILLAERLFHADSDCVLDIVASTGGDAGLAWRWKLGVCGVDQLLDALGMDLPHKRDWARLQRDAFAQEFRVDGRLKQQLGDKYRAVRGEIDDISRLAGSPEAGEYPALAALQRRTQRLMPIVDELHAYAAGGGLGSASVAELASSFVHMHLNRLLRSAHRFQELVIYEMLDRLYRSQAARSTPGRRAGPAPATEI